MYIRYLVQGFVVLHQLLLLTRGENMAETELPGQRVARRCGGWIHVSPKSSSVPELWNPVMTDPTQTLLHLGLQWEVDHPTPLGILNLIKLNILKISKIGWGGGPPHPLADFVLDNIF